MSVPLEEHPLLRCLASVGAALDDAGQLDPAFLPTPDKARALRAVDRELARLEGLRLRLLSASSDVAIDHGARSARVWLAAESRASSASGVLAQRLADALERWPAVGRALREGAVYACQAGAIVDALDDLPSELEPALSAQACAQLLADAGHFGPRELRVLGRRVLDVLAPDVAESREERLLLDEEMRGRCDTRLRFRPRGDGVTDVIARIPDQVVDRLRVYVDAFTAPRRHHLGSSGSEADQPPLPTRRGHAFCSLLEQMPASGLPAHGGTATSVVVMLDWESLRRGVGSAELSTGGRMSATEVRRLACTARLLPAVLGGQREVLDLGRSRRLFSPAQRRALAVRDRRCRAEGCDIPATWCEAHHAASPWSSGGRTDLADGVLLCSFHHHRAQDLRWDAKRLPTGEVRYRRRT